MKWSQWSCIIESDDLIHNKILKSTLPINYKRVILVSWSKSPISRPSRIDTLCNNGMCFNLWSVWSKRNSFICSYRLESLSRRKQGRRLCSIVLPHLTRAAELSREVSIIPMPMYNSIHLHRFKNTISIMVNFISKDNLEMLKFHSLSFKANVGRDYQYIEIKNA